MSLRTTRILLIEDNPGDVRLLKDMLANAEETSFELVSASLLSKGLEILTEQQIDIILLDLGLPDCQGLETFDRLKSQALGIPVVVLTSLSDESMALETMRQGAQDYLVKGEVNSRALWRVIRYAIERKRAEETLRFSLLEKEALLREIHHRVKNNMQVIMSLIHLQAERLENPVLFEMFRETQDRIRSMALIHEWLYDSQDLARIDFSGYIKSLVSHLFRSHEVNPHRIHFEARVGEVDLDINTAIPCGLILNELVSNALKHAFPKNKKGKISVYFFRLEYNKFKLLVRDDGIGLPENLDFRRTETLGMQIVTMLVNQLEGTIELKRGKGSEFKIIFKELHYPPKF